MSGPVSGKGAVLFLHAYPLNRSMWKAQADAVQGAGWMFVAPDFPGFGDAPYHNESSLDQYAAWAVGVLESVEVDRAVVVGLSMGGYVAFRLFESRPELVRALVLADTRAGPDSEEGAARRLAMAERAEHEGLDWLAEATLAGLISEGADEVTRDDVLKIIEEATPEGVAAALRAMAARPDSRPGLGAIGVPTLVLVGAEDSLTPPREAEAMVQAIPGARLEVIAAAGHLSNVEKPEAFNRLLLGFLEGVDAKG